MPRNSFMVGVDMPRNTPSAVTATGPVAAQACAAESNIREQRIGINNCGFRFWDFSEDMMTLLSHCPDLGGGHYSSNQAGKYTRGKVNLPNSKFFDPFNVYGDTINLRRLRAIAGETLQGAISQNSISCQTNVDVPVDVQPFLGLAKNPNQFLKSFRMLRSVFEPCQKIKRLANIAAMIKLPCDRRQISYAFGDVMRFVFENVSALLLR